MVVRPLVTRERRPRDLDRRFLVRGDFVQGLIVRVPDVKQRSDGIAEQPGRFILGPLQEDVAFLAVVADDLYRIAIARLEILVRIQTQPDGDAGAPALGVVAQHAAVLERGTSRPLLGEIERPAESPRTA